MTKGERIKARREALGLSVGELAERLNKNRATIYRYESGEIEDMPITVLEPLAKALNTTPAYIMLLPVNVYPRKHRMATSKAKMGT